MVITKYKLLFLALGLSVSGIACAQDKQTSSAQKILASENGRFVFGQVSHHRQDQFMLDTKTGRLWQLVERKVPSSDGSTKAGIVLQMVPYSEESGKLSADPK